LDEFELNWVNLDVWYDVVSMFVSNIKLWSRHNMFMFRRGDTRVEMVRMCIVWEFDLKRYPNSNDTLDSIDESYQIMRVERDSYGHVWGLKYEFIKIGHMD